MHLLNARHYARHIYIIYILTIKDKDYTHILLHNILKKSSNCWSGESYFAHPHQVSWLLFIWESFWRRSISQFDLNFCFTKWFLKGSDSRKTLVSTYVPHVNPIPISSPFQKDDDFLIWVTPADSKSPEKGK